LYTAKTLKKGKSKSISDREEVEEEQVNREAKHTKIKIKQLFFEISVFKKTKENTFFLFLCFKSSHSFFWGREALKRFKLLQVLVSL
jgi:hypothetical protein